MLSYFDSYFMVQNFLCSWTNICLVFHTFMQCFFTIHRLYSNWVNTPFYISTVMPLLTLAESGDIRVQWTPLIFLMKQKQQPFLNPNYASIVRGWFLTKCLFFVLIVNLRLPPPHATGK